jgi:DNA topoisomerase-2
MVSKKEEHDAMELLSEKDLWCKDLDDFVNEWEVQLKEEEDYQKSIRNTNRRVSKKIGAGGGKGGRGRPPKVDAEYNPKPLKANPNKGIVKVEQKPHQRFLSMFENKPKPKPGSFGSDGAEEPEEASGLDDDDFSVLKASNPAPVETSRENSEQRALPNARGKRAAAAAPKKWVIDDDEESESDDDKLLGDVGAMVKGIGGGDQVDSAAANGRLSLFAMSRPGSSHGRSTSNDLPKLKSKPSRTFDLSDDNDETNYEMLARSSPHKAAPAPKDNLDSFLSDDDELVPIPKKAPAKAVVPKVTAKPAPKPKKAPAPKKAAAEPKKAEPKKAEPKLQVLSPAAKAYAAKQNKMKLSKNVFSDDEEEEEEEDVVMEDSPPPKPAARGRGRPARAAAAAKPSKPIYIDSDDEDDMDVDDNDESALVNDASEDDFDESE